MMIILGIESSCDETAAAIVRDGRDVLSSVVASQDELHMPYGGVVPEIACRAHIRSILPVIRKALADSAVPLTQINAIAVAHHPGLIGSLLIGLTTAKTLAWLHDLPLIGVNHLYAHAYAAALERHEPLFPCVTLVASGGHTSLFHSHSAIAHELLGSTRDDAAGEAFDKVASILNLGYPGGPHVNRIATSGNPRAVRFPRTRFRDGSLDFSFSGIKTAVLYHCRGQNAPRDTVIELSEKAKADVAASFQEAVVDVLVNRLIEAAQRVNAPRICIGGGVAANSRLRERLERAARKSGLELALPPMKYCIDNAAMVAGLGYHLMKSNATHDLSLDATPTGRRNPK